MSDVSINSTTEMSAEIGELAKALALAHTQFGPVEKDSMNPHFKSRFASLAAIIKATKDGLNKNGLAITQLAFSTEDRVGITTRILHVSGEWISSSLTLKPTSDTPQAFGSALTYARRYSLSSMLNIAAEEDDDGQVASDNKPDFKKPEYKDASGNAAPTQQRAITPNPAKANEKISEPQQKRLFAIAKNKGWGASDVAVYLEKAFGLNSSGDILRKDYEAICTLIETISPMKAMKEIEKKDVNLPASHMPPLPPDFGEIPF